MFLRLKNLYPDKIEILQSNNVQGREFKYVVLDVNFKDIGTNNTSAMSYLK
jgi:hypothetical protein